MNIKIKSVTIVVILSLLLTFCYSCGDAREMPFEQIDGKYKIELYDSFESFNESDSCKSSNEHIYNKGFFSTYKLIIIKFNDYKNKKFYIKKALFENSNCNVDILPVVSENNINQEQQTKVTYYCYLKTKNNIKDLNVKVNFLNNYYRNDNYITLYTTKLQENTNIINSYIIEDTIALQNYKEIMIDKINNENYQMQDSKNDIIEAINDINYDEEFFKEYNLYMFDISFVLFSDVKININESNIEINTLNLDILEVFDECQEEDIMYNVMYEKFSKSDIKKINAIIYNVPFTYQPDREEIQLNDRQYNIPIIYELVSEGLYSLTYNEIE